MGAFLEWNLGNKERTYLLCQGALLAFTLDSTIFSTVHVQVGTHVYDLTPSGLTQ